MEVESYVRGLARRRPDVVVTTLRLANLMGAGVDSQVTRYLSLPVVPRVMGFDARLQFLHPTDAVEALLRRPATTCPAPTTWRPPTWSRCPRRCGMMGRPGVGVPQPVAPIVAALFRQARLGDFSTDQIDALTYGRGMDTTRFTATAASPRRTAAGRRWRSSSASAPRDCSPRSGSTRAGARSPGSRGRSDAPGGRPWLTPRSSSWAAAAPAGRGSRTSPSAAARGLAAEAAAVASAPFRPPPIGPGRPARPMAADEPLVELDDVDGLCRPSRPRNARIEAPPTLSLGALVAELVDTIQQGLEGLATSSSTPVRDFAADPLRSLLGLVGRLGVDWPGRSTRRWPSPGRG